jgi:hypothetical protein
MRHFPTVLVLVGCATRMLHETQASQVVWALPSSRRSGQSGHCCLAYLVRRGTHICRCCCPSHVPVLRRTCLRQDPSAQCPQLYSAQHDRWMSTCDTVGVRLSGPAISMKARHACRPHTPRNSAVVAAVLCCISGLVHQAQAQGRVGSPFITPVGTGGQPHAWPIMVLMVLYCLLCGSTAA